MSTTGKIVLIVGRPSAGKSTFANHLSDRLAESAVLPVILDGDEIRRTLVPRPGYSDAERRNFYATLAGLAKVIAAQGHCVLVAATTHRAEYRAFFDFPRRVIVFVDAPEEQVRARDAKGLYAALGRGSISGLPGGDVAFDPPDPVDVVAAGGHDESALDRTLKLLVDNSPED